MKFEPVQGYLVATFQDGTAKWRKYKHGIKDKPSYRKNFESFAKSEGAAYVNYYQRQKGTDITDKSNFLEQVKF